MEIFQQMWKFAGKIITNDFLRFWTVFTNNYFFYNSLK